MANDAIVTAITSQRLDNSILAIKLQNQAERAVIALVEEAVEQVEETNAAVERKTQQRRVDLQI